MQPATNKLGDILFVYRGGNPVYYAKLFIRSHRNGLRLGVGMNSQVVINSELVGGPLVNYCVSKIAQSLQIVEVTPWYLKISFRDLSKCLNTRTEIFSG